MLRPYKTAIPMTAGLIGNSRAVAAVKRALTSASPPHAWLFVGPEGVGKAALARWLAQAVNCQEQGTRNREQGTGNEDHGDLVEPCGKCAQCDRIARGIHSDVLTVLIPVAEGNEPQHKDISVDQVREVQRAVALAPFEGRTRVVIIDPADKLSEEAQNAFLKTLEEPPGRASAGAPPNAVFVLIATQRDSLLLTVRSRCALIEFGLVPMGEIEQALRGRGVDEERVRLLARLSNGRPEWALAMADDASRLDEKRGEALEQARALAAMPMGDLMDLGERLAQQFRRDREPVLERVDGWLSWWRDVLLVSASGELSDGVANVDMLDALRDDAGRYNRDSVVAFVQALRECRRRLEGNVQARIALDALLVRVPRGAEVAMRDGKGL